MSLQHSSKLRKDASILDSSLSVDGMFSSNVESSAANSQQKGKEVSADCGLCRCWKSQLTARSGSLLKRPKEQRRDNTDFDQDLLQEG